MSERTRTLLGWLGLLALAVSAVGPVMTGESAYIGDGVDVYGTFWFYGWVSHCIETGTHPGFTDWMFHPYGKDIFAHTGGNIIDAVVSVPFQWLLGTPHYQPVFIVFVLLANTWAFRKLLRGQGISGAAEWGASALWMLNPYVMFELLTGRITQAFLVFLPLAFHHFMQMGHGRRRDAIYAGLFTAAQAWTYWFMGLFMAVAFAGLAAAQVLRSSRSESFWIARWAMAAASCALVVLPGVLGMTVAAGAGDVPGIGGAGGWDGWLASLSGGAIPHLHGLLLNEANGVHFVGYATWGALCVGTVLHPRTRNPWGVMLAVAVAFSVGPQITLGSNGDVPMPHYLFGLHMVPFIERLWFPYRWVVMAMFAACVAAGVLLSRLPARTQWPVALLAIGLGLAPQYRADVYPLIAKPWTMSPVYAELSERGGGLIELPMMVARESLMYQPQHGMVLFGGMGENAPVFWPDAFRHKMGNHFVRFLRSSVRSESGAHAFEHTDLQVIRDDGSRWVVLDRHALMETVAKGGWFRLNEGAREGAARRTVERISEELGAPVATHQELVVWDLDGGEVFSEPFTPTPETLTGIGWMEMDWVSYEATLDARLSREGVIQ